MGLVGRIASTGPCTAMLVPRCRQQTLKTACTLEQESFCVMGKSYMPKGVVYPMLVVLWMCVVRSIASIIAMRR